MLRACAGCVRALRQVSTRLDCTTLLCMEVVKRKAAEQRISWVLCSSANTAFRGAPVCTACFGPSTFTERVFLHNRSA